MRALGKVLAQEAIGVLVRAAVNDDVGSTKRTPRRNLELDTGRRFPAAIPSERPKQLLRHGGDCLGERVLYRHRAVAGQCWSVPSARDEAVADLAWEVDQHGEPDGPLNERRQLGDVPPCAPRLLDYEAEGTVPIQS
jgi:hypothetical protein